MTAAAEEPRRRGRRPAGEDTRGAILAAARAEFADSGYDATTMRGIARAAGVDARLVHHYFPEGKGDLFVAALEFPVRPQVIVDAVVGPGPEGVGVRLVHTFLGIWDSPEGRPRIRALLSAATVTEEGQRMFRQFLARELLGRIAAALDVDRPELRAGLVASHLVGIGMTRVVLGLEPMASATADELAAIVGPTLQRYLTDPLP